MKASGFHFVYFRNGSSFDMAVQGSSGTPINFDVTAPEGDSDLCTVRRVCAYITDGVTTPAKFGGLSALANGLRIVVLDANGKEALDFLEGESIKTNMDWGLLTGVDSTIRPAAGDDGIPHRWTLANAVGEPGLELEPGQIFRVIVQDDLRELTEFRMFAQGKR